MILPGLAPHHTRQGFGSASRLYVEKYAPEVSDFVETERGLWLLPPGISEWDRWRGEEILTDLGTRQKEAKMRGRADITLKGARILGRTSITETGCMVGGLRGKQEPEDWALRLAEYECGSIVFTELDEIPYLQVCDDEECYNPRHFDIEYGRPTLRERKVELNPIFYETMPDGRIKTIWGDTLPSVETSLAAFIDFQRQNYPYVPYAESKLTAASMSQIRVHPVTGCWETWQYYCKPEDNLNWQFDGYGRLYQRYSIRELDKETGEILSYQRRGHWMAHRVAWVASGRRLYKDQVLNHMCSYRRCCNPLHLEQISIAENNQHGRLVQAAIKGLRASQGDVVQTRYLHPKELADTSKKVIELYIRLAA